MNNLSAKVKAFWEIHQEEITDRILDEADDNTPEISPWFWDTDVLAFPFYGIDDSFDKFIDLQGSTYEYEEFVSSIWQAVLTLENYPKYEKIIKMLKRVDVNGL